ncbi:DUF2171 domain-containing protein [Sphingomonas lutea]|nr:DUF2171 domain-containing protein [Sphingomonas lutea]
MAYDRYDPRNERSRWRDDDRGERNWRSDRERSDSGREERGFFERAGDEIASWFGDDDSGGRRQHRDERPRGRFIGRDDDHRSRSSWSDNNWDRGNSDRDDRSEMPSGWGSRGRESSRDSAPRSRQDYRPITGDYGRSEQYFAAGGMSRGGQDRWGSQDRSPSRGDFDPHYASWRDRHVSELDRDYEDYRRENQKRFEDEFTGWRQQRQAKRGLLSQIREHMEVLGNDNDHVGTVDRVAGDRIILTKSDPESGGTHHSLMCTDVESIDGDKVMLGCSAEDAKKRWRDENRDRALFEREDQGEAGPHMLDRSFEGTYR